MKKQLMKTTTLAFAVAAAVVMASVSTAEAGHGHGRGRGSSITTSRAGANFGGGGFGFGGFAGGGGGLGLGGNFYTGGLFQGYSTNRIPTPPYFAIHPPVYYSAPVPRTYGYSPFAYPGHIRTPDLPAEAFGQPAVVNNPYCSQNAAPAPAVATDKSNDMAATSPKLIVNPFVREKAKNVTKVHLAVEKK